MNYITHTQLFNFTLSTILVFCFSLSIGWSQGFDPSYCDSLNSSTIYISSATTLNFPTAASGDIIIQNGGILNVNVRDLSGKTILQDYVEEVLNYRIDNELDNGIYLVSIMDQNGLLIFSDKIIKIK